MANAQSFPPDPLPKMPLRLMVRRGLGHPEAEPTLARAAVIHIPDPATDPRGYYQSGVCSRIAQNVSRDPEEECPPWAGSILAWCDLYGPTSLTDRAIGQEKYEPLGILYYRLVDPFKKILWQTTRADLMQFGRTETTPTGEKVYLKMGYWYKLPFNSSVPLGEDEVIIQDIEYAAGTAGIVKPRAYRTHQELMEKFFTNYPEMDAQEAFSL